MRAFLHLRYYGIHHVLPPRRDTELTSRLCHCNIFAVVQTKTKKYCSLIYFHLANY